MKEYLIFAINPGSTSTKVALFKNEELLFKDKIDHWEHQLEKQGHFLDQIPMRKALVMESLKKHGYSPEGLSVVMGRGGLLPSVRTGGYKVNARMLSMILNEEISPHASNLGAVLADFVAQMAGVDAYIYDAVSANEFPPIAKITGMKEIERKSFYHVLNCREVAFRYARSQEKRYEDMNLIVAHLGGGITVGAHVGGKVIDSLADDNGPFGPERSGSLPILDVIEMCYSGHYTREEMFRKVRGMGGLRSLLGTSDGRKAVQMARDGDSYAALVLEAMAYQIAKGIGILVPALGGRCDGVIITGGLAHDEGLVENVKQYLGYLKPIVVIPGEFELEALAAGGLRIIRGEERAREL